MKTLVNPRRISLFLVLMLVSLYASSFLLPVFKVGDRTKGEAMIWNGEKFYVLSGWQACSFLIDLARNGDGQFFALFLVPTFGVLAILANPVFWLGLFLLGMRRWLAATMAGVVAVILAGLAYWMISNLLLAGYYVWLSSIVGLFITGWIGAVLRRRQRQAELIMQVGLSDAPHGGVR